MALDKAGGGGMEGRLGGRMEEGMGMGMVLCVLLRAGQHVN